MQMASSEVHTIRTSTNGPNPNESTSSRVFLASLNSTTQDSKSNLTALLVAKDPYLLASHGVRRRLL